MEKGRSAFRPSFLGVPSLCLEFRASLSKTRQSRLNCSQLHTDYNHYMRATMTYSTSDQEQNKVYMVSCCHSNQFQSLWRFHGTLSCSIFPGSLPICFLSHLLSSSLSQLNSANPCFVLFFCNILLIISALTSILLTLSLPQRRYDRYASCPS